MNLDNLKLNDIDPEAETLADKIKAIKELLDEPPDGLWNYDLLESICIWFDENKWITEKQKEIIEEAWEKWCN